jgi:uncharacterized protein (TIGR03437 family)
MRALALGLGAVLLVSAARAQAPAVNPGGIVNAASYATQGVAPGSIIGIFGTNLAGALAFSDSIPLSVTLGTVSSVTFNGVSAPLYYAGPLQVNAQMPYESLASGSTSATVNVVVTTTTGGASASQPVTVLPAVPGIFTVNESGVGPAIATDNNDGAIAAAAGSIQGLTTHPWSLSSGHALVIWCTGLGAVTPPIADGANSYDSNGNLTLRSVPSANTPVVLIGGVAAKVVFAGLAPAFVGEYQVDVTAGTGTPTGDAVSVQIQMNGVTTSDKVTIAVGN